MNYGTRSRIGNELYNAPNVDVFTFTQFESVMIYCVGFVVERSRVELSVVSRSRNVTTLRKLFVHVDLCRQAV